MSFFAGDDLDEITRAKLPFDYNSCTTLWVNHDQLEFSSVEIYVAKKLRSIPGGLSHYAVKRDCSKKSTGCEDGTCGEKQCPDCEGLSELEQHECHLGLGSCVVPFTFEGHQLWVWKRIEGPHTASEGIIQKYPEILLFTPGRDSISILQKFVRIAYIEVNRKGLLEGTFILYRWHKRHQYWRNFGEQAGRPSETLILPGNLCDEVILDVEEFLSRETRKWYISHGIPYKRSFLFYGPPGSGKSSMVRLLASRFSRPVCYLQPSELTDSALADAIESLPRKAILALEDVDSLFAAGRVSKKKSKLTFSGVLNVLDGLICPQDGQILILTSNHPERLDPAMIRSGRIDKRYELPSPGPEQMKKLFLSFYPEAKSTTEGLSCASVFVTEVSKLGQMSQEKLSMALLQNLFILGRKLSYRDFLEELPRMFEAQNCTFADASKGLGSENGANGEISGETQEADSDENFSQDDTNSSQSSSDDDDDSD